MKGKLVIETVGSVALKGNALGDPRLREIPVYLPPSYLQDPSPSKRWPVIYYLVGFTGTSQKAVFSDPWRENIVERFDRLVSTRKAREAILVIPDCFTRLGGSQYRNSEGTGRYEDHIVKELVGYIDSKYRTTGSAAGRAVMGKSSGGYGALMLAMGNPDVFSHAVSHSGDMFFELCYGSEFPRCATALGGYDGSFLKFLTRFASARDKTKFPHELINMAGMASCYSPNKRSDYGFDLPFDERTGETNPKVFKRWLENDPVRVAPKRAAALKKLTTLFFDCGTRDEFHLHLGARKFSDTLKSLKVKHAYEEHEFGHFDMSGRYDVGFARLTAGFKKAKV
jgi:enterochelin esterase family protein